MLCALFHTTQHAFCNLKSDRICEIQLSDNLSSLLFACLLGLDSFLLTVAPAFHTSSNATASSELRRRNTPNDTADDPNLRLTLFT
jgi:hypothetical protein